MRFRVSSRPPAYLDRPLQWRLLTGVAVVAAMLFVFQAYRLSKLQPSSPPDLSGVNFSVDQEPHSPLRPDEFRIVRSEEAGSTREPGNREAGAFDESLLQSVRDNTLGIRREEAEAFYAVLEQARSLTDRELLDVARDDVLYINLMTEPDRHRGRAVTFVGDMWRCYELPPAPDRPAGERLYEAWVFTNDSGTHPYRVVAANLDSGLRVGEQQRTPVRITGFFFKREGYNTPGGLHVAPTILARSIARYQSPHAPPPADELTPILLGVLAAVGLILAATFLSFAWSDRRGALAATKPVPFRGLDSRAPPEIDERSVQEMLQELSERDRFGESWPSPSPAASHASGNGQARNLPPDDELL